jgi:hypothetical protein
LIKGEWSLNGRFVKTKGSGTRIEDGKKQKSVFMAISTYDLFRKQYVGSVFWSVRGGGADYWGGSFNASSESSWDAKTQTMKTASKDSVTGITEEGTTHWSSKDKYTWRSVTKDADGNVLMEQIGKGVRRKK